MRGFGGAQFNNAARSRSSSASSGVTHRANTTPHGHITEQVAVPGGLGRVAGHRAVRPMITDELFKVGDEGHGLVSRSRSINSIGNEICCSLELL